MFCTCGATHALSDVFCGQCGIRIYGATIPTVAHPDQKYCRCGTPIGGQQDTCSQCAKRWRIFHKEIDLGIYGHGPARKRR